MQWVFLTEETSIVPVLTALVPKINPALATCFQIKAHRGLPDLFSSLPTHFKGWLKHPHYKVFVLLDKDNADCLQRKLKAESLCAVNTQVQIVCKNLESWILGDLQALENAYGKSFAAFAHQFDNPEILDNPKQALEQLLLKRKITQKYSVINKNVAPFLSLDQNKCYSFKRFIKLLHREWENQLL
jgi:Domain of unknown function (DUF4276)